MWKRTFSVFTKIRVPWHLYILQVILGIIVTKIGLLYIPYESRLQTGDIGSGNSVLWGYIGFSLLTCLVSIVAAVPEFYASAEITKNLQNKMISHALHMPVKSYEKNASKMVSWIVDDCTYANGLLLEIVGFLTGIASTVMSISSMSAISKSLMFILPVIVVYIIFSTWLDGRLLFLRERRGRKATSDLTAYMAEHLGYFRQIKQMHTQEAEKELGRKSIDDMYRAEIYQSVITLLNSFVSGSLNDVITILVFISGAALVRAGSISLSDLAAFQSYILVAYQSISSLPSLYSSFMYYNGNLFYVANMMDEKEETCKRSVTMNREDEDIIFENVSFAYEDHMIIKNASFRIPKGKVTMIVGPNGSGKTTLFKLIERFYTPVSGTIKFGGIDAEHINLDEWRKSFGYVLQDPQLFSGTIKENITYGMFREVTDAEIETAAKLACADGFIHELAGNYDFDIGEGGENLSAGQKQRLAIARALLPDPSYILLDEATCNMDVQSEAAVHASLFDTLNDKTIIIISHDLSMLKNADNVIVINNGVIEASGRTNEVMENSKTLRELISA